MNFFDAQDQAKRATRWLVVVYVVSTLLIVAGVTLVVGVTTYQGSGESNRPLLVAAAVVTTLVILGATLFRMAVLSAGGGRVATGMGGTLVATDTQDPLRRRLRHVVEEMAIASGVPVPEIYVLEEEDGINAFAAGFTTGDAAIAVTRGALELLDREELQGVIAHEFSHILNGDMRLNVRMMGVLFGIMVIGLLGRMVLRGGYQSGIAYSRRSKNGSAVVLIGLGLTILGWIGVFFARVIKAAVSRQREFLADASAVQFTRQTDGISNALKKIGGYSQHSFIRATDPEEVSHMLFARGAPKLASLFATHPPLGERIQALDPSFRESDYPRIGADPVGTAAPAAAVAGLAPAAAVLPPVTEAAGRRKISESVGKPTSQHLGLAKKLRRSVPAGLLDAAHSPDDAYLLTIALIIDKHDARRQLDLAEGQLGEERTARVRQYHAQLQAIGARYWLPLLEVAFPALKQRPAKSLEFLLDLVRRLIELDGETDLREFCFYRILGRNLQQAAAPAMSSRQNRVSKAAARQAAIDLLYLVAEYGSDDPQSREQAFREGLRVFGDWAGNTATPERSAQSIDRLGESLDILGKINFAGRQSLVEAIATAVASDGRLQLPEAELLRAICTSLDCPLPPIMTDG